MIREFKAGRSDYMKAQKHVGENIGETDTHVMILSDRRYKTCEREERDGTVGTSEKDELRYGVGLILHAFHGLE